MKIDTCIRCKEFPCDDVNKEAYQIPAIDPNAERIKMVVISEAVPADAGNNYYAAGDPLYRQTSLTAFADAGFPFNSLTELLERGIYFTNAVKCAKTAYGIKTPTILECSKILAEELALFPNVKVIMLMGDVAIKAMNAIARDAGEPRVIPAGSTYKIRGEEYTYRGMRVFPCYLQVGPSFNIEKSKRRMIAEDISRAMKLI